MRENEKITQPLIVFWSHFTFNVAMVGKKDSSVIPSLNRSKISPSPVLNKTAPEDAIQFASGERLHWPVAIFAIFGFSLLLWGGILMAFKALLG